MIGKFFQISLSENELWTDLVSRIPIEQQDPHIDYDYNRFNKKIFGQESFLIGIIHHGEFLVQVMRERNIPKYFQPFVETNMDLASPYGFGGIYSSNPNPENVLFEDFFKMYENKLRNRYICEFHILTPDNNFNKFFPMNDFQMKVAKSISIIDLQKDIWANLNRGHKSSINKAHRMGVEVLEHSPDRSSMSLFKEIHLATLKSKGAEKRWLFPDLFYDLVPDFFQNSQIRLFSAQINSEILAMHLVLLKGRKAYYFFGGSYRDQSDSRASHDLIFETAITLKSEGFHSYNLGGGVTNDPEDALLRFKSGFTSDLVPLDTAFRVIDSETYKKLSQLTQELTVSNELEFQNSFHPHYRSINGVL